MERKRNIKIVPISSDDPRARNLDEAVLFVDNHEEDKEAIKFVRKIRQNIEVVPSDPKHSDFPLPVLITGDGSICRRLSGIQRAFGKVQRPIDGGNCE